MLKLDNYFMLHNLPSMHVGQFRGIFSHLCGLAWSAPCTLNQESTTKMADNLNTRNSQEEGLKLNLRCFSESSERGDQFWNTSVTEMKFSVERQWIKAVRKAENKPDYGMTEMDPLLEEVIGNKLEMVGPLVDSYLKEVGKSIYQKLCRSKATGLMNPVVIFIPWAVYRHVLTMARGYSGEVEHSSLRHKIVFNTKASLEKMFAPSRFSGECFIACRHFKKVPSKSTKKLISIFNGKSVVVSTTNTPFTMDYSRKAERVTITFYVQRYTTDRLAIDISLQTLMNRAVV